MIIPSFFIIIPPLVHHFQSLVHHYSMTIPSFPPIFHHCSMIILSSSIIIPSSSILAGMRLPHFPKGSSCQLPGHAWSAPFRGYLCSLHGLRGSRTTGLAGDLEMLMFYGVLWFVNLPIGWLNMENIWENHVLIMVNFMVLLWVKQCHKPSLKSIQITKIGGMVTIRSHGWLWHWFVVSPTLVNLPLGWPNIWEHDVRIRFWQWG